nr:reverse transcriptase domain-containing protein [Tanacetum cinerariifolium]
MPSKRLVDELGTTRRIMRTRKDKELKEEDPIKPVAPPSPDYVPRPEHLASLDYVPGPENPLLHVYVPKPEYPEYLATWLTPILRRIRRNPEEDHTDYPADGGDGDDEPSDDDDDDEIDDEDEEDQDDDEEEEEHLAPADSSAVPIVDPVPRAGDTKAFETDESAPTPRPPQTIIPFSRTHLRRARKTVRLEPPMSASMEACIAKHDTALTPSLHVPSLPLPLPSPLTTSPTDVGAPLGYRAAGIRMRALLPSTSRRTDILEADMSPRKKAFLTTPALGFEVGESSTAGAARQPWPALESDRRRYRDAQDDRALLRARVNTLFRDRPNNRRTAMILDREHNVMQTGAEMTIIAMVQEPSEQGNNYTIASHVKYASFTFQGSALTWWNSHELALMCDRMFLKESTKVERYVGSLPDMIHGSVKASKPQSDCPKLKNENQENRAGNGNVVARAYVVGTVGTNPNSDVVTCMFLLNNRYASILFDTNVDRSFVSTAFSSLIDIIPTTLDHGYDVELANGRIIWVNTLIRGCNLNFLNHPFNIDLMPAEMGSFEVIIGMDWLSKYHAVIVCDEKLVRVPFDNEILIFHGDGSNNRHESRFNIISCTKTQKYLLKGYPC